MSPESRKLIPKYMYPYFLKGFFLEIKPGGSRQWNVQIKCPGEPPRSRLQTSVTPLGGKGKPCSQGLKEPPLLLTFRCHSSLVSPGPGWGLPSLP